jgi:hypothetical protein
MDGRAAIGMPLRKSFRSWDEAGGGRAKDAPMAEMDAVA